MSAERTNAAFLEDILVAAEDAMSFVQGLTLEQFAEDKRTIYAVIRACEIIGEATKRVSPSLKAEHPHLPWKVMAGMRDKLIHDYFGVDLDVVWLTVTENLPQVTPQLRLLLSQRQD